MTPALVKNHSSPTILMNSRGSTCNTESMSDLLPPAVSPHKWRHYLMKLNPHNQLSQWQPSGNLPPLCINTVRNVPSQITAQNRVWGPRRCLLEEREADLYLVHGVLVSWLDLWQGGERHFKGRNKWPWQEWKQKVSTPFSSCTGVCVHFALICQLSPPLYFPLSLSPFHYSFSAWPI